MGISHQITPFSCTPVQETESKMVAKTLVAVASVVGLAVADSYVYRPSAILAHNSGQLISPATGSAMSRIMPSIIQQQQQHPVVYTTTSGFTPALITPLSLMRYLRRPCDYLDGGGEYEINVSIDRRQNRQKRSVAGSGGQFTGYLPFQQATVREIPSTVVSKQYHSQDEFGNYKYGYTNPDFEKHESGNANSEVKGHYSYIDEKGNARRLYYVADSHGFHITGDDVPGRTQTYLRHKRSPTVPEVPPERSP